MLLSLAILHVNRFYGTSCGRYAA